MEIGLSLVFHVSRLDKIQFNETMEATKQEPKTFVMIIQWAAYDYISQRETESRSLKFVNET
jgi:hypothetical protein